MKNRLAPLCLLALLLSAHLALPAQEQDKVVRKKPERTTYANITLEATEAKDHVGQEATVCGKVVSTRYLASARGTPTFLNFEKPYPDHVFTAVIWGRNRGEFGEPERKYKDKEICVTGTIERYRGKPQIEAKSSKDIVLKGSKIKQN
jgi:DNA/RNA endonuclease YhcR with UshA esterase domain